jgi:hypothetical protein
VPERFALPVCTTVVLPPPVAFAAAPNAAPAARPFATGWLLCCSSAGGGGGAGGGCSAGGGVCDDARGTIAVGTASAIPNIMSDLKAFIWASFLISVPSGKMSLARPHRYDASGCPEAHSRDIPHGRNHRGSSSVDTMP